MKKDVLKSYAVGVAVFLAGTLIWAAIARVGIFHPSAFPSPESVIRAFGHEFASYRLVNNLVVSLFRVTIGFVIAAVLGIPAGIWMGHSPLARSGFLPALNFFRSLSPLAWMPFAILWFGVGDAPAIFLIFLSGFFPVVLTTMAAVANIPAVYFRVAETYRISGMEKLLQITLPAIMPQVITTLRVTAGLCWLVVVAAEMIAGRDGLGFAVMDSRNGLRMDYLVANMTAIGLMGVALDRVLLRLTRIPSVRWGYEQ
jgi:NitT/TauT family transport system permease protein